MSSEPNSLNLLNLKSLREQVYDYLRLAMNRGDLAPSAIINLNTISRKLGVSKTPLRDALLQLEVEGFVTILPRRGYVVNGLTREDIRNLYQVIGSLESAVISEEFHSITPAVIQTTKRLNAAMHSALDEDDFDKYYEANLQMHDCYLDLSSNACLRRIVKTMKQRLYDFPRKQAFVKEWEINSTREHDELIRLFESGDSESASKYIRNVHWSYDVQKSFIEQYYQPELEMVKAH